MTEGFEGNSLRKIGKFVSGTVSGQGRVMSAGQDFAIRNFAGTDTEHRSGISTRNYSGITTEGYDWL